MLSKMGQYFMAATVALILQPVMAVEDSTISTQAPEPTFSAKGIRVSLIKSFLDLDMEAKAGGVTKKGEGEVEGEMGLSVGYAFLPIQKIGFIGDLAVISVHGDGDSTDRTEVVRFAGSAAYAFNSNVHIFGGANYSTVTEDEDDIVSPSVGLQLGVGVQATKNLGVNAGYILMRQDVDYINTSLQRVDGTISWSGPELAIHGTF